MMFSLWHRGLSVNPGRAKSYDFGPEADHNPEVVGSNPAPAIHCRKRTCRNVSPFFCAISSKKISWGKTLP